MLGDNESAIPLSQKCCSPRRLTVDAVCHLDDEALKITAIDLDETGDVPEVAPDYFEQAAREFEQDCPVSGTLKGNAEISLKTHLEGHGPLATRGQRIPPERTRVS